MAALAELIRTVPDFPKKGIGFKDITTLIKHGDAFREAVDAMLAPFANEPIDAVLGVEARGFIFAAAAAYKLGVGIIPARKPGKLPAEVVREEYALEYGTDAIEVHKDAITRGQRVLVIDDLLATGGTTAAAVRLVERLGGIVVGVSFLIELSFLNGRQKLEPHRVYSVMSFASE
ncbi:MAG: adenine phosphoribosyltransferase [candidate division KSB1 bacterium]|nr:adenine phosphoribosyltransferase [candidate division KSB1 bacterium]MDZ7338191.1 adenine phosphoribosyltransferase [candidate division KSB1 bacterium]MDZ7384493.1 adenine phosphoribosyltransferase [candidate division KSB1 bacterium]MDZ7392101.1 adenine phosphoribosyltransferase [candidate division KSB1 bacterium]MDZ7412694.1 adenine phosphoribosyltransferase [candidate division KSB1 bacterium]